MTVFKINGERNSGTNFLTQILKMNKFPTYDQTVKGKRVYHWKHGVPSNDYKELDKDVIDLFVFRSLDDWLISMFKNPYELVNVFNDDFGYFLNLSQKSSEHWKSPTNEILNKDDNGKTIFQIRYYKFKKIIEYSRRNKNVIFLNLKFIQNETNLSDFLDFLSNTYIPKLKVDKYMLNIKHTKNKSNEKNRVYSVDIHKYRDIIDSKKDEDIETFINNLTFTLSDIDTFPDLKDPQSNQV